MMRDGAGRERAANGGVRKMKFEKPCYVTTHAVERFKERFANLPPEEIMYIIQLNYNKDGLPINAKMKHGKLSLVYRGTYKEYCFCFPVVDEEGKEWPIVPTVTPDKLHKLQKIREQRRPWTTREERVLPLLIQKFTIKQCAEILGRSHMTISRHITKQGLRRRTSRTWTEREKELAVKWYSMGKNYEYIAKRLGRTENAIEIFFCRRRKAIRSDPEKQAVLKALSFCFNPNRVLRAARDAGLLEEVKRRELCSEIDLRSGKENADCNNAKRKGS